MPSARPVSQGDSTGWTGQDRIYKKQMYRTFPNKWQLLTKVLTCVAERMRECRLLR